MFHKDHKVKNTLSIIILYYYYNVQHLPFNYHKSLKNKEI